MFALRLALGGKSRGAAKKKPAQGGDWAGYLTPA
jgi:hypothetical protein